MSGSIWGGGGLSSAQVAQVMGAGYASGQYTWMGVSLAGSAVGSVDNLRLYPFQVFGRAVVSSISLYTSAGGAGSFAKCAVWRNNRDLVLPTGLPIFGQNAGFDTSGTGANTAAVSNVVLASGWYWAGTVHTGTAPTMISVSSATQAPLFSTGSVTSLGTGRLIAQPYANDIMALDLTAASPSLTTGTIAAVCLGWA